MKPRMQVQNRYTDAQAEVSVEWSDSARRVAAELGSGSVGLTLIYVRTLVAKLVSGRTFITEPCDTWTVPTLVPGCFFT